MHKNELGKRIMAKGQKNYPLKIAESAHAYVVKHKNRHVTLEELAKVLSVSQTSLKRYFQAAYGESVYSFLRKQKMYHAAQLLAHTDQSILDIACLHGYQNASKFSAAFHKVMGMNPSEYRKQQSSK